MRGIRILLCGAIVVAAALVLPAEARAAGAAIDARLAKTSIDLGQSVVVSGTVTPAGATPRVYVQRSLGGGRWSDRAAGRVAANGTFSVSIKPSASGLYALRVRSGGGSVVSKTLFLKVKLGAAQAIRSVNWARFAYPVVALCGDDYWTVGPESPVFGDLTGDGIEEAVVPLTCYSGGTLNISMLAVFDWRSGAPRYVTRWVPTGLPTEWPAYITRTSISARVITTRGTYAPLGSCHACHTGTWTRRLVLRNGRLTPA